jgi:hypothetical protein
MAASARAEARKRPFFSRRILEKLDRDQYSWWAKRLSEDMIGEFCSYSHNVMHLFEVHRNRGRYPAVVRLRAVLEVVRSIYGSGETIDRRKARRAVRKAMSEAGIKGEWDVVRPMATPSKARLEVVPGEDGVSARIVDSAAKTLATLDRDHADVLYTKWRNVTGAGGLLEGEAKGPLHRRFRLNTARQGSVCFAILATRGERRPFLRIERPGGRPKAVLSNRQMERFCDEWVRALIPVLE